MAIAGPRNAIFWQLLISSKLLSKIATAIPESLEALLEISNRSLYNGNSN
jgi:hypothetical protein